MRRRRETSVAQLVRLTDRIELFTTQTALAQFVSLNELNRQMVKRIGIEWHMRSAAIVVALSIVFFSTSGWSEVKYFKIPAPPEEPDKVQTTPPEEPVPEEPVPEETAPKSKPPKTVSTKKQKPQGPYILSLQVSSFQTLEQARNEESRLKAIGVDAFIRHEKVRGKGMWYRVYIGKFNSKRQALDHEKRLKEKGIIHWS